MKHYSSTNIHTYIYIYIYIYVEIEYLLYSCSFSIINIDISPATEATFYTKIFMYDIVSFYYS